ncbi:MAG: ABC transporter ATP-binding protein [Aestuariivita sp.]|nr:ABC transporter ATP-binding protein [Aestuariivita sp.]
MFRFFENLINPYASFEEKDAPPQKLWPFMLDYARPFKGLFIITAILSTAVAAIEIGLIFYMGRAVDILVGDPAQVWSRHGLELILVALFVVFVRPAIQAFDVLFLNNAIMPNFGTMIRWRAHKHVLRQSVGWFESDFAGRIANRIMQTPPAAGEVVFQVFDAITFSIAYLVGATVLLLTSDPRLLMPLLLWFWLYGMLVAWTIKRVGPASKAASDARSAVTGRVVDSYTNIHSVKMFAHHDEELAYAKEAIEHTRQTFSKEMRIYTIMDLLLVVLNGVLIVSVVGWAIYLWMQHEVTVGVVAAATALTLRLNAMTGWIMWALTSFFRQLGVVAEGMETIAQPIELVDHVHARPLKLSLGKIEVENVSHHYGRDLGGLDRISLTINPGEKVGLIGQSGAGKSTLVKLLLRFHDPEEGRILVDGQDIATVTQTSLRQHIGMVQQDSSLLHRSARENIMYGRPDATEDDMIRAAKAAEAHEFIEQLRDQRVRKGYDAYLGERGVKLSGGQRQRVALARAILKDAPILILDEATSALDSEVEAAIQVALHRVMENKTVLAIAHRLSTLSAMDRIVVLHEGRIAEQGTQERLLAKGGLYAKYWNLQSGGFIRTQVAE